MSHRLTVALSRYGTPLGGAIVFLLFAATADNFINPVNLANVVKQISYLTIIGLGFTMAFLAGELDLSVAHVASLSSVVCAALLFGGQPVPVGIAAGLAVGAGAGILNGLLVTVLKIPSLIATIAVSSIASGLAFFVTDGVAYVGRMDPAFLFLGRGSLLGVPMLTVWLAVAVLVALFFVKQTRTGFHLVCTGEAETSASRAGIRTRRMKVLGLALSGTGAAVTGVLLTSALSSSSATIAGEYLMTGIAAVLLGMTMIEPGRPNVVGTLVGALIIGMISNGLTLAGAQYYVQDIVLGLIILVSVSISASRLKRAAFSVG